MASVVKVGVTATDEGFKQTMQDAARSAIELGKSMDSSGGKSKTLNGQLREARKAAMELTLQWRELDDNMRNSDFGQSLKAQLDAVMQRAGELQDIKGDVASEIKNIASDTAMWDGAKQGIGILSSSMQGLASVVGLCGGNVESFTKALNIMKGVEAVTNTVIGIGNALQKQSALMVALRAVKTKLLAAAQTQATTAIVAETGATEAQTTAQLANNAAVLANPYVAVAAAIIAITAAIVAWVAATDDATEVTEALHEATEGATEANKEGYKTFIKMQVELDAVKQKVDNFNGSLEDEKELVKELNDKYGDSLGYYKDLASWKAALADVSYYYCKVLEMEAKLQAIVTRMGDAYADMMAGEGDYDAAKAKYEKYKSLVADAQDDLQAYQFMLKNMINAYGGSLHRPKASGGSGGSHRTPRNRNSSSSSSSSKRQTEADKQRQTALEKLNKEIEKYNKLYDNVKDKDGKGRQKALEYETKIISLEKQKLDYMKKGTDEYANQLKKIQSYYDESSSEFKKYAEEIRSNEIQGLSDKLDGLDLGIAEDYDDALSTIREIISKLQEGTDEYTKWQEKFKDMFPIEYWEDKLAHLQIKLKTPGVDVNQVNAEIDEAEKQLHELKVKIGVEEDYKTDYDKYLDNIRRWNRDAQVEKANNDGSLSDIQEKVKQENERLEALVKAGKMTKEEAEKAANDFITNIDNFELSGVMVKKFKDSDVENIVHYWKDKLDDINNQLENNNLDVEARLDLYAERDYIQEKIDKLTQGDPLVIKPMIEPEFKTKGSDWWKQANYDAAEQNISRIVEMYENGLIKSSKEAKKQIAEVNAELIKLGMKPIIIDIQTEGEKALEDAQDYIGTFNDVVVSTVDSFDKLFKSIEDGASAWDIFKNAISSVGQVLGAIQTVMQVVDTLTQSHSASVLADAAATEAQEIAQTTKMGTDSAAVEPALAKAAASEAAAAAMEQEAAAAMFAAHAEIPFVGAALGAAQVAIMEGVLAGIRATQLLASGGIVQGSTTVGDRVLVGLNAGEMVLSQRQQRNLFDALDHGIGASSDGAYISTVKVRGEDIILSLKNYAKVKHNKELSNLLK